MTPQMLAGLYGLTSGLLIASLIAWLWFRSVRARDVSERQNRDAIIRAEAEAQERELTERGNRLQAMTDQLAVKEESLQQARVAEATLIAERESLSRQVAALESRLSEASRIADELRTDNSRHREQISHLTTSMSEQEKQNKEKFELLEQARASLNVEFRNLANEIFDAKQRSFREQSQTQLDGLLKPLNERIKDFEKRVESTYSAESKERFSLIKEVKGLQDLNARISKDAVNLTNALKGENKTQGTWGEVILERVLERSGLEKGREYEVQVNLKTEDGRRLQPDVVVHLPEGRDVIVDSKVSLVGYERFSSADDDAVRVEGLKAHVQSIRNHVRQLADKDYQKLENLQTLDFVILFIPVEGAFAAAIQHDAELFSDAFDKNIMVVSPSTLLATLRMIHNIWRFEQQNKNAQEIARRAGALYDKFVNFVSDLEEIGIKLGGVQTAYDRAHNKLSSGKGNLVTRAEGMKALGAKVSKSLPENLVEMPARDDAKQFLK